MEVGLEMWRSCAPAGVAVRRPWRSASPVAAPVALPSQVAGPVAALFLCSRQSSAGVDLVLRWPHAGAPPAGQPGRAEKVATPIWGGLLAMVSCRWRRRRIRRGVGGVPGGGAMDSSSGVGFLWRRGWVRQGGADGCVRRMFASSWRRG